MFSTAPFHLPVPPLRLADLSTAPLHRPVPPLRFADVFHRSVSVSMLVSSLYVVIAYEASIGEVGPKAILYMVPAALVIFFGKPNMVKLFACVDSIEVRRRCGRRGQGWRRVSGGPATIVWHAMTRDGMMTRWHMIVHLSAPTSILVQPPSPLPQLAAPTRHLPQPSHPPLGPLRPPPPPLTLVSDASRRLRHRNGPAGTHAAAGAARHQAALPT